MISASKNQRDRKLLLRAVGGCTECLEIIWHKYRQVISACLRKTNGDDTAEDVCQTVYSHILQGNCNYDGSSDVKAYLNGMASKTLKSQARAFLKRNHVQTQVAIVEDLVVSDDRLSCPVEALSAKEQKDQQEIAILELPPKSRQAVELVYRDGIPAFQAAEKIDCDFDVFRQRLEYGLRCLSQKLNTDCSPED